MSTFPNDPPLPTDAPSASQAAASSPLPQDPTSILGVAFTEGATPFATGPTATSTAFVASSTVPTASSTDPTATSTVASATSTVPHDTVALVSDRTSTTVITVDKPPMPIMGGLLALSKTEWAAWTGGKPLSDWSGLEPSARNQHVSPNQLRPALVTSAQKGYNYRRTGLEKELQYTTKTDLSVFQNSVWKHLRNSGMDTISYLPDPEDPTKMTSVVTNHARFTLRTAKKLGAIQLTKYDPYDSTNDEAARTFLLKSITTTISQKIEEKLEDDDPFFVVWLEFIQTIQSTSIERFEDLKLVIKTRHPSQYPGENLEMLGADFRRDARELSTAGQYDHNLTLAMIKIFLQAGGAGNEDFRFPLRTVKQRLDKALLEIGYKEKSAANQFMAESKLTYKDICRHAEETYRTLLDRKEWPPARNARDIKTPPSGFGNLADAPPNLAEAPLTRTEVMNLVLSAQNGSGGGLGGGTVKGNCHKCGKPGHWSKECPDGNSSNGRKTHPHNPSRRNESNGQKSHNIRQQGQQQSWRSTPPAVGAPLTKKVKEKVFSWCAKCHRWTTTHTTNTHTGKKSSASAGNSTMANHLSMIHDPSVWLASTNPIFGSHPENSRVCSARSAPNDSHRARSSARTRVIASSTTRPRAHRPVPSSPRARPSARGSVLSAAPTRARAHTPKSTTSANHRASATVPQPSTNISFITLILLFALPFILPTHPHPSTLLPSIPDAFVARLIGLLPFDPTYWSTVNPTVAIHLRNLKLIATFLQVYILPFFWPILLWFTSYVSPKASNRPADPFIRPRLTPKQRRNFSKLLRPYHTPTLPSAPLPARIRRPKSSPTKCRKGAASNSAPRRLDRAGKCRHVLVDDFLTRHLSTLQAINNLRLQKLKASPDSPKCLLASPALKMALQAPLRFRNSVAATSNDVDIPIIWDSGASVSISPIRSDFVDLVAPAKAMHLSGIAKNLAIKGHGTIKWMIHDAKGSLRTLELPAYYVPGVKVRLLSTTSLLQTYPNETISIEASQLTLSGVIDDPTKSPVQVLVNPATNLPTSNAYSPDEANMAAMSLVATINEVQSENFNLSEPHKELLRWHYRLGHIGFRKIQFLMRSGVLSHTETTRRLHTAACRISTPPRCAACQYGKQTRRPTDATVKTAVTDRQNVLKTDHLYPGQCVSVDHFICHTEGRLFNSAGKTKANEMFKGGCIFVDHASGYVHVEHQVNINTHQTLRAKEQFERICRDYGVMVQSYLSDNGSVFTSPAFTKHLQKFEQVLRYAGVGAHHHNGVAERNIQTIMAIARTMMLHSSIHWPQVADASLWPMAVSYAVFLHNHMPNLKTGMSPSDIFTKSRWEHKRFNDLHVWGSPVYVLDKAIADGRKLPRWTPRSVRMMHMGVSPTHATSVPLLLNPSTGYITAQFNVVFDDWFTTVSASEDLLPDFNSPTWAKMFGESFQQYTPLDDEDEGYTIEEAPTATREDLVTKALESNLPPQVLPVPPLPTAPAVHQPQNPAPIPTVPPTTVPEHVPNLPSPFTTEPPRSPPRPTKQPALPPASLPREQVSASREQFSEKRLVISPTAPEETQFELTSTRNKLSNNPFFSLDPEPSPPDPMEWKPAPQESPPRSPAPSLSAPTPIPDEQPFTPIPQRRSFRTRKPPQRLGYDGSQGRGYLSASIPPPGSWDWLMCEIGQFGKSSNNQAIRTHLDPNRPLSLALKASPTDPDTLTFDEAMAEEPDQVKEWLKAASAEIESLEKNATWRVVDKAEATSKILPGTWVFRRKRTPDGRISKYKARYCVRGDLEDESGQEKFAPVVAWSTVRLFLTLSLTLKWETCTIDFSSAFVQAPLQDPVWIHLPRGFRSSESSKRDSSTCLRLLKSLYGLSVAPRLWYQHLLEALTSYGFRQCANDPCLLYTSSMLIVVYVDDLGIAYSDPNDLDKLFKALEAKHLSFTREGSFTDFLGIKFERNDKTGTLTLTQKGLINKILEAAQMTDCKPNWTPTTLTALGTDPDGPPMSDPWNYRSIIGMLLYLSTNTRPDITFAVSQAARFSHSPKQSHATAVKMILRYLKRTVDCGMIIKPSGTLDLHTYVDADFAGLHGREPDYAPESAKSRTGYIVFMGNCPIIWKSQLQSEITLSTLEAEYSALSSSLRTVLPLRSLLAEVVKGINLPPDIPTTMSCRVFEDNNGALLLATQQKITNRTKYFRVKWHHFWQHVRDRTVDIQKICTTEQRADYLTKGLSRESFERIRKLVQGW